MMDAAFILLPAFSKKKINFLLFQTSPSSLPRPLSVASLPSSSDLLPRLLKMLYGLNFKEFVAFLSAFSPRATVEDKIEFIFKVYDTYCNGKVSFNDMLSKGFFVLALSDFKKT
ncbi:hypothetical protein K1719_019625 [Acacia pycnantha]|nr:hypothetical protein K1719_019625 [Acacia pycnantha]